MLETTLAQLEQLVAELVQRNAALDAQCAELQTQLQQAKDENDNLQLAALEQEEQQTAALSRLQDLVQRVSTLQTA